MMKAIDPRRIFDTIPFKWVGKPGRNGYFKTREGLLFKIELTIEPWAGIATGDHYVGYALSIIDPVHVGLIDRALFIFDDYLFEECRIDDRREDYKFEKKMSGFWVNRNLEWYIAIPDPTNFYRDYLGAIKDHLVYVKEGFHR